MHQAFIRQHHYHKMRPIVTILTWLCLPPCMLVTCMSCAKTAEPTETLFGSGLAEAQETREQTDT